MKKNSLLTTMIKLDLKDKKLCYQLDLNARQSLSNLAKNIGLSKQAVAYRIDRLQKLGVIKGFYTVMDMTKLGFLTFKINLKILKPEPKRVEELISALVKSKHCAWLVEAYGEWDFSFVFVARSVKEFADAWQDFLSQYRDSIREKEVGLVTEAYQFYRGYLVGNTRDDGKYDIMNSPPGGTISFDGDKKDWEILKAVAPDARLELQAIAARVGLTPKAVSYRLKNLQKRGVIQSYRPMFDVAKLGYEYYKVFLGLTKLASGQERELFTWLRMHPNVVYVTKAIGKADYEFELQARGREEFWSILNEFRGRFKNILTFVESLHFAREHKSVYIPEVTPV